MINLEPNGDIFRDIGLMQEKFGINNNPISKEELWARLQFAQEELNEAKVAFIAGDAHGVLDGLIDLTVVAAGTVPLVTSSPIEAWNEVMRANLAKETGKLDKRPGMGIDLVKPDGWEPPDLLLFCGQLTEVLSRFWKPGLKEFEPVFHDMLAKSTAPVGEEERGVVQVLRQCIETFIRKGQDYNDNDGITIADYFPEGSKTFSYIVDTLKRLRLNNLLKKAENGKAPNFDSIEDILIDRIVYIAMWVEWMRGKTPGQHMGRDIFNREIKPAE